ncbi:hypothetical protein [Ruegeria sp.]|uniref:hypothetical protein n=1 Tax=Ruegeria sp. TaxID=1879320 RepID=UPI003AFF917C
MMRALSVATCLTLAPGLTLVPGLSGAARADPPPGPGTPQAWLEAIERRLVGQSGHVMEIHTGDDPAWVIFYTPLGQVWHLDGPEADAEVLRTGLISRTLAGGGALIALRWEDGGIATWVAPAPLPVLEVQERPHPLARFHDRLLSRPLHRPVGGLPAGARFLPGRPAGVVRVPDAPEGEQILWESLGDHITLIHPDGQASTLFWQEIRDALGDPS